MSAHPSILQFDSYDQFYDHSVAQGWSDGFPVVPPEPEQVENALAQLGVGPGQVVASAPHRQIVVTAQDVALHSVLAGCRPEYAPVVLAAVQSFFDGIAWRDREIGGIAESAQCVIVNGPIRKALDINCGLGAFGPGWRANATIGRALRLLIGSLFGAQRARCFGDPAMYSFCFGEDEENSPWVPLHVERGFPPQSSTATVHSVQLYVKPLDRKNTTPETLLDAAAAFLRGKVAGGALFSGEQRSLVLVFGHEYYRQFGAAGWTKARMREYLFPKLTADDGSPIYPVRLAGPDSLILVAAGGLALSSFWCLVGLGSPPATKLIPPLRRN